MVQAGLAVHVCLLDVIAVAGGGVVVRIITGALHGLSGAAARMHCVAPGCAAYAGGVPWQDPVAEHPSAEGPQCSSLSRYVLEGFRDFPSLCKGGLLMRCGDASKLAAPVLHGWSGEGNRGGCRVFFMNVLGGFGRGCGQPSRFHRLAHGCGPGQRRGCGSLAECGRESASMYAVGWVGRERGGGDKDVGRGAVTSEPTVVRTCAHGLI